MGSSRRITFTTVINSLLFRGESSGALGGSWSEDERGRRHRRSVSYPFTTKSFIPPCESMSTLLQHRVTQTLTNLTPQVRRKTTRNSNQAHKRLDSPTQESRETFRSNSSSSVPPPEIHSFLNSSSHSDSLLQKHCKSVPFGRANGPLRSDPNRKHLHERFQRSRRSF